MSDEPMLADVLIDAAMPDEAYEDPPDESYRAIGEDDGQAVLVTPILYFDERAAIVCDGRCDKAWGTNNRPRETFDNDDPDDIAYLADDDVGEAPAAPGTWEGGHGKPQSDEQVHNKWCVRECERSQTCPRRPGGGTEQVDLTKFEDRVYNQPWKHEEDA